jgi:hypothetical protein
LEAFSSQTHLQLWDDGLLQKANLSRFMAREQENTNAYKHIFLNANSENI